MSWVAAAGTATAVGVAYFLRRNKVIEETKSDRCRSCRSCGAAIIWLKTKNFKKIPVDYDSVEGMELMFEPGKHVSHFATCPNADQHRKRR